MQEENSWLKNRKRPEWVDKPFQELTKEEFKSMTRTSNRYFIDEMMVHYKISAMEYCMKTQEFGLQVQTYEKDLMWKERDAAEAEKKKRYEQKLLEDRIKQSEEEESYKKTPYSELNIPDFVLCAIYNVPYEVIDKKRYYDKESLNRAKEDIVKRVRSYLLKDEPFELYRDRFKPSNIKPIELVAMRIFRGMKRNTFSELSGLSIGKIVEYESKQDNVPARIADIYQKTLKIKEKHLETLRGVMNGEISYVETSREIPPIIKVQVWKRDKGKCSRCGSNKKLHFHHIKHFADGGLHTKDNLALLCAVCHAEEHKGEPAYYMLKKQAEED